jgi:hypothetical protein
MSGLTDMAIERLEQEICSLCAELSVRLARWLDLVAEFDRREGARRWGFRGSTEWLAWKCGLSRRAARDHVRVARGLVERPMVRAAFAAGELSYSKVRALTRAPADADETELLALARSSTAGRLECTIRGLRRMPSADTEVANAAHARRFVDWSWEPDGSLSVRARLSTEDGAAFIEAIERGAVALYTVASDSPEPLPPLGARHADALAEIARSGAPRAQVVLHVDGPALACTADTAEGRAGEVCRLEDGPAVPSETARRLACDGELAIARPVHTSETDIGGDEQAFDRALDYGRKRRVVPPPLRAALERRDGHCRFPGCERRHDLHAHHIRHWIHGGRTDRDNLILLCRFHHRLVHEDGFTIECARGGGLRFRRPDGRPIPHAHRLPGVAVRRPREYVLRRRARRLGETLAEL